LEDGKDSLDNAGDVLVLPGPDYGPPGFLEASINESIPLSVAAELWFPIVDIASGDVSVLRAGVPEASVNKDGNPVAGENDIWANRQIRETQAIVHPKTKSVRMEGAAHGYLWLGVALEIPGHAL
jgi:hypothetical protein